MRLEYAYPQQLASRHYHALTGRTIKHRGRQCQSTEGSSPRARGAILLGVVDMRMVNTSCTSVTTLFRTMTMSLVMHRSSRSVLSEAPCAGLHSISSAIPANVLLAECPQATPTAATALQAFREYCVQDERRENKAGAHDEPREQASALLGVALRIEDLSHASPIWQFKIAPSVQPVLPECSDSRKDEPPHRGWRAQDDDRP